MSQIRVNAVSGDAENTPVHFPQGLSGDGRNMLFPPEILAFTPAPGAVNVSVGSNIVLTFDQPIQFSVGIGTIKIRKDSVTGTVHESYTTGSSGNLTISNNQLTINPSTDLDPFATYFLEIPNVGIANTMGVSYKGNGESPYKFSTANGTFGATGGFTHTHSGYRYHVFLASGPLVFDYNTKHAGNITLMLVGGGGGGAGHPTTSWAGGGGGGGGVVVEKNFKLPEGEYVITVGSGGGQAGGATPNYYGGAGNDTFIEYGPTHPQYSPNSDDRNVFRAYGGGGGYFSHDQTPSNARYAVGSGGGINGYYALQKSTFSHGFKNADGYGGRNMPGQGNRGGGSQGQPSGPNPNDGPNRGRQTAGGGGGAGQAGQTWSPYPNPPNPSYPGTRSGWGGDGRAVPEFSWNNWGPYMNPNILPIPGTQWAGWSTYVLNGHNVYGCVTGIGPSGYYGGGGGGGSARQPNPAHPAHENYMTAGRGGLGGGGHGYRVYANISTFGYPVYDPNWSNRPLYSPFYPSPNNYAANGAVFTGGGGGGTTGPAPSYRAGSGGSGIAMLRYPV